MCRSRTCSPGSWARRATPADYDTALFRRMCAFHARGRLMAKAPAKSPAELLVPGRALTLSGVADGAEGLIVADLARADRGAAECARDQPRW